MRALWRTVRRQPALGFVASLVLHLLVLGLVFMAAVPTTRHTVKRGEPLFVEFPELNEPPPRGNPAARTIGPPERPAPRPAPPAPRVAAAPPAPPAPPAPAVRPQPAPSPPKAASQPEPQVTPPAPPPVAAPAPPPEPVPPPQVVEPTPPPPPVAEAPPAPAPPPPPPPVAEAPPTPSPPAPAVAQAPPAPPAPPAPAPPSAPAATPEPAPGPQVAMVPPAVAPAPEPPPVDIRSALGRGGGAGGTRGSGRGGIEGEPIPLDSPDAKFSDYLDRLRRRIKAKWGFPCIKGGPGVCEYKTTSLVVEFGILKDGRLQFVDVVQSSGFPIYDDYAVNAIKFASPFPAVPPEMIVSMKRGSTGVAIMARFNYVVDTSLTNLLR